MRKCAVFFSVWWVSLAFGLDAALILPKGQVSQIKLTGGAVTIRRCIPYSVVEEGQECDPSGPDEKLTRDELETRVYLGLLHVGESNPALDRLGSLIWPPAKHRARQRWLTNELSRMDGFVEKYGSANADLVLRAQLAAELKSLDAAEKFDTELKNQAAEIVNRWLGPTLTTFQASKQSGQLEYQLIDFVINQPAPGGFYHQQNEYEVGRWMVGWNCFLKMAKPMSRNAGTLVGSVSIPENAEPLRRMELLRVQTVFKSDEGDTVLQVKSLARSKPTEIRLSVLKLEPKFFSDLIQVYCK